MKAKTAHRGCQPPKAKVRRDAGRRAARLPLQVTPGGGPESGRPPHPLAAELAERSVDHGAIAERVGREKESLAGVFAGLQAEKANVRYGCLKVLRILSETQPAVLYGWFDQIGKLLTSENTFLKWGSILMVGNLAAVDVDAKIEGMLEDFLRPISGEVLITAANTIRAAGQIARAKPHLAGPIVRALLAVEQSNYQTPECRNVALGQVVEAFDLFFARINDPQPVVAFVQRQLDNRRNAVRRKAAAFLKKHGRGFGVVWEGGRG